MQRAERGGAPWWAHGGAQRRGRQRVGQRRLERLGRQRVGQRRLERLEQQRSEWLRLDGHVTHRPLSRNTRVHYPTRTVHGHGRRARAPSRAHPRGQGAREQQVAQRAEQQLPKRGEFVNVGRLAVRVVMGLSQETEQAEWRDEWQDASGVEQHELPEYARHERRERRGVEDESEHHRDDGVHAILDGILELIPMLFEQLDVERRVDAAMERELSDGLQISRDGQYKLGRCAEIRIHAPSLRVPLDAVTKSERAKLARVVPGG